MGEERPRSRFEGVQSRVTGQLLRLDSMSLLEVCSARNNAIHIMECCILQQQVPRVT